MLFGDYVAQHPRWAGFKKIDNMATPSKAAGGTSPGSTSQRSAKGNGHMLMQDKNNMEVAEVIQKWVVSKGLVD
jgi:hypothetical protein